VIYMGVLGRIKVALSGNRPRGAESLVPAERNISSLAVPISTATATITDRGATENRQRLVDLEKIYRLDGLVFGIVNKYARDITGNGYTIEGDAAETVNSFARDRSRGFNKMLRFTVRDSLVYGFSIFELVHTKGGILDRVLRIDPKAVEFKKTGGRIDRDIYGFPKGFEYTDWQGKKKALPKEKVAFFTLFPLNEGDIGISPLEVLYKPILYKLNIEDASAEALWRTGFPAIVAKIGDEKHYPTEKEMEGLAKDIKKLKSRSAFILPFWQDLKPLDLGKPAPVESYLEYFSNLIRECLGLPRINASEIGAIDYERTVIALQEVLAEQIEEQVFPRILPNVPLDALPRLKFNAISAQMGISDARRRAVLARSGLITWDPEVECEIRRGERLPSLKDMTPEEEERRKEDSRGMKKTRLSKEEVEALYGKQD